MREQLIKAKDVQVGDWRYDNRTRTWPVVERIEPIAAGRLAFNTTGSLFVDRPEDLVLVRRD